MSKLYEKLDDKLKAFIARQKMFFVASAPLSADGHVNVSPKGLDSFKIIDDTTVAYLDMGGSGIETQAHTKENGRITFMFCAFEGKANIVRLYGKAESFDFDHPDYASKRALFDHEGKARAVIVADIHRISDSCGWGVPFYEYKGDRDQLTRWIDNADEATWKAKRYKMNSVSIDGLPGLEGPGPEGPGPEGPQ